MTSEEFDYVLEQQIKTCRDMLSTKAGEYAAGEDRLHNFKQAAHLQQVTPVQALGGMMVKHTVSIYDMISADEEYPLEKWDEKITDHLNYLILLRACLIDEAYDLGQTLLDN